MKLRMYQQADLPAMAALFYDTVHAVCMRDYTPEQLHAWAPGCIDEENWHRRYTASCTLIAEQDGQIIGFGNMEDSGYLDMLYVHKDHQHEGIATYICDALEEKYRGSTITVHASITARPFFLKRGYREIKKQTVICRGITMTNFVMEKRST